MKSALSGSIRIENAAEYETALMAVETLMEVAEDSEMDPLDPLIRMLFSAIQTWEAKDPKLDKWDDFFQAEQAVIPNEFISEHEKLEQLTAQDPKAPNFTTREALAESEDVDQLERISSIDETLMLEDDVAARATARLELIQIAKRTGITLCLLEANDGLELIRRVQPWFANRAEAEHWFLDQRIVSFGDLTPAQMIQQHGDRGFRELLEYITAKELGGFE